jgi:hypothetical protein
VTLSHALLYAFMDAGDGTRAVMTACARLRPGRVDVHQDAPVRRRLRELDRFGYAFSADGLWFLTERGERVREAFGAVVEATT